MDNTTRIQAALTTMLAHPAEDGAWVVIEHPSGKFVQFTGSVPGPLLLDLPWQPLSEAEFYRAVAYFKKFGVAGDDRELFDVNGNPAGTQFTFNLTLESEDSAAAVALVIFEEVYRLPRDFEFRINASWEQP
jgi:hypothetical protein